MPTDYCYKLMIFIEILTSAQCEWACVLCVCSVGGGSIVCSLTHLLKLTCLGFSSSRLQPDGIKGLEKGRKPS